MSVQENSTFPHRLNPDKTYDSICRLCYQTIASATIESDLTMHEGLHSCAPPAFTRVTMSL
jgi:hypothetical protein